ncbi:MAG TPA: peptidylprolyl isomerase [Candidatus Thermoplasmatota archaeon]
MRGFAATTILIVMMSGCLVDDSPEPSDTTERTSRPGGITVNCPEYGFPQMNHTLLMPELRPETKATLVTNRGEIEFVLYAERSPITVCNFVQYALEDYYEDTVFHRICPHVIQAGGMTNAYTGTAKPGAHPPIRNEANLSELRNYKYTFGMARTPDPDSASTHFFINNKDNNYLDFDSNRTGVPPGYAVFANITKGQDVADAIAAAPTVPEPDDVASETGLVPDGCGNKAPAPGEETIIEAIIIGS